MTHETFEQSTERIANIALQFINPQFAAKVMYQYATLSPILEIGEDAGSHYIKTSASDAVVYDTTFTYTTHADACTDANRMPALVEALQEAKTALHEDAYGSLIRLIAIRLIQKYEVLAPQTACPMIAPQDAVTTSTQATETPTTFTQCLDNMTTLKQDAANLKSKAYQLEYESDVLRNSIILELHNRIEYGELPTDVVEYIKAVTTVYRCRKRKIFKLRILDYAANKAVVLYDIRPLLHILDTQGTISYTNILAMCYKPFMWTYINGVPFELPSRANLKSRLSNLLEQAQVHRK